MSALIHDSQQVLLVLQACVTALAMFGPGRAGSGLRRAVPPMHCSGKAGYYRRSR